ncbi:MAG: site-specific DNA-methyltransferase, partial [Candidatus Paceibacterota bacterium]
CKKYTFNYEFMKKLNGGKQMKDTDWVFGLCKGNERLKDENGIKAHPTQKPLKLIQQVILASSNKGDIVFDPFVGSGTTAVVAEALGRKWLGIEKDEKYVNLARNRVKDFARSRK